MTPNDYVWIKPTEGGWKQIQDHVYEFNDHMRRTRPNVTFRASPPVADANGYIKEQFWCAMRWFNWTDAMGRECPFSDLQLTQPHGPSGQKENE